MTRSPALLLLLLGALPSAEAARGESWRPVWRSGLCSAAPFPPALNPATVPAWHTPSLPVCPIAAVPHPWSLTRSTAGFTCFLYLTLGVTYSHSEYPRPPSLADTSPKGPPESFDLLTLSRPFPGWAHNLAYTDFQVHI